jgi:tripartite-type tricarboxylate transporter receptor subunit TctC
MGVTMERRTFLLGAAASAAMPAIVKAQSSWPERPVTIIVPFGAGGSGDLVARLFAKGMQSKYGTSFVVENRGGAGGVIGTDLGAKSPPDGYTLLIGTASTLAINPSVYARLPYNPETAFAPVSPLVLFANMLVVNNKIPVKDVREFIAYMKEHNGKLNFGSSGNGTSSHLSAVMLMQAVGVTMTHVPFHGFPEEMTALIDGQLDFVFDNITSEWPFAKNGQLRPLAVSTAKPVAIAPDVPPLAEAIPGFDASGWQAIMAPAGTPKAIVAQVAQDIRDIFTSAETLAFLKNVGGDPLPMQPDEFAKFIVSERAKWAVVVKAAGVRIE